MAQKQRHGAISPVEFSRLAQLANMDEYNQYTSSIKNYYQMGKGMPKLSVGMNKIIDRRLVPFLVTDSTIAISSGIFPLPSDVNFIDTVTVGTRNADWIPFNEVNSYLNSTIDVPTTDYPIYTDVTTGLKVLPASVTSIKLTYLKNPATVNWAYTLTNSRPVYNATGTVNFEWSENHKMSLVTKILGYMGLSIRDTELKQMALQEEQKANT